MERLRRAGRSVQVYSLAAVIGLMVAAVFLVRAGLVGRSAVQGEPAQAPALVQPRERPTVELDVDLAFAEDRADVQQVVEAPNTSEDEWTELAFAVVVAHDPDAFSLGEVRADGEPVEAALDGITLRVPLPEPVAPGETAFVELDYSVHFITYPPGTTFPDGMTGRTADVIRAGWWYPVLVPYRDGEGWATWRYHDVGDPVVFPAADTTLTVHAGPGVVIAGGEPVSEEGGTWTFRAEAARGMAFFASDRYQVIEGEANGIPVYSYHLGENEDAAQATVRIAEDALRLFEELFGPYPYESLVIARSRSNSDMEFTGLISLSESVYVEHIDAPLSAASVLVPHEIAHQWWYGAVGTDQVHEPWLDESLATYSQYLYFERYHPEVAGQRLDLQESRFTPGRLDMTIYDFAETNPYIDTLYPRGAIFQNELRTRMGDEAYFAFLQGFHETHAGEIATTGDFLTGAQAQADGDLSLLAARYFSLDAGQ